MPVESNGKSVAKKLVRIKLASEKYMMIMMNGERERERVFLQMKNNEC